MMFWQLFSAFFMVGLFSFGGGYAALPLIQQRVVDVYGWMTVPEFIDVTTISQMTPGPIGINAAIFVGMRQGGFLGAVVGTLGFVLPSVIIVLALSYVYFKYRSIKTIGGVLECLRPAVVALIGSAGWTIVRGAFWEGGIALSVSGTNLVAVCIAAIMLVLLGKTKAGPITVIAASGVIGLVVYGLTGL